MLSFNPRWEKATYMAWTETSKNKLEEQSGLSKEEGVITKENNGGT